MVRSSSLVPHEDPTLLFTNAGMVQFKRVFLGEERRDYVRATTSQKCVRAGGKHNDLENVGYTARHHTFFEMLGNFSLRRLLQGATPSTSPGTCSPAATGCRRTSSGPRSTWTTTRPTGCGATTSACRTAASSAWGTRTTSGPWATPGPAAPARRSSSTRGARPTGCGRPECAIDCDCDRYLEIWNLVFMQFNRDAAGTMTPLPKPSIDTGMGLERIASVIQGGGHQLRHRPVPPDHRAHRGADRQALRRDAGRRRRHEGHRRPQPRGGPS